MKKILIVDDNATLSMEFEELLPSIGYKVVGVAETGKEAIKMAGETKPDLVLMDIRLEGEMDGIEAAAFIKGEVGSGIIFISGFTDETLLNRAKLMEPLAFIHKPFSDEQIKATLKMAIYNYHHREISANSQTNLSHFYNDFTLTETSVSELVKKGKTSDEIAEILKLSPSTVIWHRKNIRKKLGISGSKKNLRKILNNPEN